MNQGVHCPVGAARKHFEAAFASWLGVPHAFAFWKGRVALYAILRALGVGEGDEVIVPGYTCVAVVRPIKYLRAKPVYVDIEPATYNIDPGRIEEHVTDRTRLIVAQHTYGFPADMDAILAIAARRGLTVIEDACLAIGSTYRGRRTGTLARAAYWSMQWSKTFTTGVGGLATTDDNNLADHIARLVAAEAYEAGPGEALLLAAMRKVHRVLAYPSTMTRIQALYRWLLDRGLAPGNPPGPRQVEFQPTFFKRMGAGQARVGLCAVRRLDANIAHRRRTARLYDELLAARGWPRPTLPDGIDPVLVRYPVRVADKAAAVEAARARHLELGTWFDSPLHQSTEPLDVYGYTDGTCPQAEKACREVVNLPTHPRTREKMARKVVDLICEIGPAKD